jgi:hypothetical protein
VISISSFKVAAGFVMASSLGYSRQACQRLPITIPQVPYHADQYRQSVYKTIGYIAPSAAPVVAQCTDSWSETGALHCAASGQSGFECVHKIMRHLQLECKDTSDEGQKPMQNGSGERGNILLVDDDKSILRSFRYCLEDAGYAVATAQTGEQARVRANAAVFRFLFSRSEPRRGVRPGPVAASCERSHRGCAS